MVGIVARALPRGEAEDVVAQAFADVWEVATLTDPERLRRYVWKAVWNGCADTHRRGRHVREVELDLRTPTVCVREFRAADARLDLWRVWDSLTAKQQAALKARMEGTPYAVIATRRGISSNGARRSAFRGWQTARRLLTGRAR